MKDFKEHFSGLWVSKDGEIYVPKSFNKAGKYTYGNTTEAGRKRVYFKSKAYSVHRLVAEVYLNNNQPLDSKVYDVHHINENKTDNRVENLQILIHEDHAKIHSGRNTKRIIGTNIETGEVVEFDSFKDAGIALGINAGHICGCCLSRVGCKTSGGYIWKYA